MRKELDENLCKAAPTLFGDRRTDMRSTAMCWGFACGDGWYDLLLDAATKLEPLCRAEFDKHKDKEKVWYPHVRKIVGMTASIRPVFLALYKIVDTLLPGVYNNPLYWYGGPPRAAQVKEKFGTLRFYMTHQTEEMSDIIRTAEMKSAKTCEECGKPGKLKGHGWYSLRCSSCWKKDQKAKSNDL